MALAAAFICFSSSSIFCWPLLRREIEVLLLGDLGVIEVVALVDAGQDLVDRLEDGLRGDAVRRG